MSRSQKKQDLPALPDLQDQEEPGTFIALLRLILGWTQEYFAKKAGVHASEISRIETGAKRPRPATVQKITKAGGVRGPLEAAIRSFLQLLRRALASDVLIDSPVHDLGRPPGAVQSALAGLLDRTLAFARLELDVLWSMGRPKEETEVTPEVLLSRLRRRRTRQRALLVDRSPAYQDWRLCVLLCEESLQAAAHNAQEALQWATLACEAARRVPGAAAFRTRLCGYAEPFLGSAHRVANDDPAAAEAFARGRRFWKEGRDDQGVLDHGRVLDLEASFCRDQGRHPEAIKLHDQALAVAWPTHTAEILLNKAYTLEVKGDLEDALALLREAAERVDAVAQPRLFCVARFNLAGTLIRLGRAEAARPVVAEVRALAERLQNDHDLVRVRWLEGNLLAGLGQREQALEALAEVRRAFAKWPFDHAMASLDAALIYHQAGRHDEVLALAAEMVAVFKALGVAREATAALLLFHDAAAKKAVTTDLVEKLQEYLKKARVNPRLRFG